MIPRPDEVNEELQAAVDSGKRITFYYSPNTVVHISTTDAAEAQQLLEACQPVEDEEAPIYIREQLWFPIMESMSKEPEQTAEWLEQLLAMANELKETA